VGKTQSTWLRAFDRAGWDKRNYWCLSSYGPGIAQNKIKQVEQPLKSGCYPPNGVGKANAEKERLNIWLRNYSLGD
jgi:hypothetical protein